jgi:hypothetical protein
MFYVQSVTTGAWNLEIPHPTNQMSVGRHADVIP